MGIKFQMKRGAKAALPTLAAAELAMTTDEKTLYYGTGGENIPLARKAHSHTAADVGAAPSAHKHPAADLPDAMPPSGHRDSHKTGGADALTAADVGAAVNFSGSGTLTVAGWSGAAAPFTQSLPAANITANDATFVDYVGGTDAAAKALIAAAWALVVDDGVLNPQTGAGTIRFYASEKPTVAIPVRWKVTK